MPVRAGMDLGRACPRPLPVVEQRGPEALVVGEHAAAEHEGVDWGQQLEAVGPGVNHSPSGPRMWPSSVTCSTAVRVLDVGVLIVCLQLVRGVRCATERATNGCRWRRVTQPLVANGCYARDLAWEEVTGWCPTG